MARQQSFMNWLGLAASCALLVGLAAGVSRFATVGEMGRVEFAGNVERGAGYDVRIEGKVGEGRLPIPPALRAKGRLDPLSGRAEVTFSGGTSLTPGFRVPARLRFYNTPTGELDYELPSDVRFGPFEIAKGRHVIGEADAPKRR